MKQPRLGLSFRLRPLILQVNWKGLVEDFLVLSSESPYAQLMISAMPTVDASAKVRYSPGGQRESENMQRKKRTMEKLT